MRTNLRTGLIAFTVGALISIPASVSSAATILKLNLGGTGPDVEMVDADPGVGIIMEFQTVLDPDNTTDGDQNTNVEFTGFLDIPFTGMDIPTSIASFSISDVARVGVPDIGFLITQQFFGGKIKLFDPSDALLLEANLQDSAVAAPPGGGDGGFFTVTLGTAIGGSLLPYITPGTISMSMPLSNINGGMGLLVIGNELQPFNADASANISADPIPEPVSALLILVAASMSAVSIRRSRRS